MTLPGKLEWTKLETGRYRSENQRGESENCYVCRASILMNFKLPRDYWEIVNHSVIMQKL